MDNNPNPLETRRTHLLIKLRSLSWPARILVALIGLLLAFLIFVAFSKLHTHPPPPTLTIKAEPAEVKAWTVSTLTWESANATSCTASGDWTGPKTVTGSQPTDLQSDPALTMEYSLTCFGPGGSVAKTAIVKIIPEPPHKHLFLPVQ